MRGSRPSTLYLIYDGECPFCRTFARFYALRKNIGSIELIDAREKPHLVQEWRARGMEINGGMLVLWRGHYYHGARGMHLLSILGSECGLCGLLNRFFRNRAVAMAIYPLLVTGRKFTLSLLGRKQIPYR